MGQNIKLTASDHFQLGGYPAVTPKAAVVVIQEIFGVNHHIRAIDFRPHRTRFPVRLFA